MFGYLLYILFLASGLVLSDALMRRYCPLYRVWLGLAMGLVLMMWTPAFFAFFTGFTKIAQLLGLGLSCACASVAQILSRKEKRIAFSFSGSLSLRITALLVVPLMLLSVYLLYTHTLRNVDGALFVGQSTYGDLNFHMGITTSLINSRFPPEYSILPGTRLGYPFLVDALPATMMLFGADLALSYILESALMMFLVYLGFVIVTWELTNRKAAVVLAFILFFLNGGLGFIYSFNHLFKDPTAFFEIFTGWYKTPTNQPDLNLYWVNILCDMLVPQRTFLAGLCVFLPALFLLNRACTERRLSLFIVLGVWGGLMPLIHTHSFLALGFASFACLILHPFSLPVAERRQSICHFLIYGIIAVIIALPQLIMFSFHQSLGNHYLHPLFNWVNNDGRGGLKDEYFWFWIKNVGPVYVLIIPAVLNLRPHSMLRRLALGAAMIYLLCETIVLQPNTYDNNKLFYDAFLLVIPSVALFLCKLWDALKSVRGRALLAAVFLFMCTVSGSLSIVRECLSNYCLYSRAAVNAADYIRDNSDEHACVLTGVEHNNPVSSLAGRNLVCGTSTFLYFHGLDYSSQYVDARQMLESPAESSHLFEAYDIDLIYVSGYERNQFDVDEDYFIENCDLVFEESDVCIYRRERA